MQNGERRKSLDFLSGTKYERNQGSETSSRKISILSGNDKSEGDGLECGIRDYDHLIEVEGEGKEGFKEGKKRQNERPKRVL